MLQDKLAKLTPEQLAKVEAYCTTLLNAKPIDQIKKSCGNCKYEHLGYHDFPCSTCDSFINFTPK